MKRALSRRAADTFVLASAEKIGAASRFRVLPITDVSGIVTDAPPTDAAVMQIAATGTRVIHAGQA